MTRTNVTTLSGTIEATKRGAILRDANGLSWRLRSDRPIEPCPTAALVRGRVIDPGTIEPKHITRFDQAVPRPKCDPA